MAYGRIQRAVVVSLLSLVVGSGCQPEVEPNGTISEAFFSGNVLSLERDDQGALIAVGGVGDGRGELNGSVRVQDVDMWIVKSSVAATVDLGVVPVHTGMKLHYFAIDPAGAFVDFESVLLLCVPQKRGCQPVAGPTLHVEPGMRYGLAFVVPTTASYAFKLIPRNEPKPVK